MSTIVQRCITASLFIVCVCACGSSSSELNFSSAFSVVPTTSPQTSTTVATELVESVVADNSLATAQIVNDFSAIFLQRAQCGRTPEFCPVTNMAVAGSEMLQELRATMADRVKNNLRARKDAGKLRVRIESVEIVDTIRAVVHTCVFDSVVLFDSGQVDSIADDIVFDDIVISVRTKWNVQQENGIWKWRDAQGYQRRIGGDLCGFTN